MCITSYGKCVYLESLDFGFYKYLIYGEYFQAVVGYGWGLG